MNSFEPVAYFTSRIMYSLNSYGHKENMFANIDKKILYGGEKISYSSLLSYKRAKGKIITFTTIFETFDEKKIGEYYSGRKNSKSLYNTRLLLSTIFLLEIHYKKGLISNGINIENISIYKS